MKLRKVEVRNWACIESLVLTDLKDGVIILHGPNRTGKSSLVQAIRSTLFDHLHDSQDKALLSAIPLKSKATPHVVIDFEHAGRHYRITKTFARTKEGGATLEQIASGSASVLERGKEAAKKVRELIGAETSEAGVFQMLWLGQRDFTLPEPRDIDGALRAALEAVLGNLITGRDIAFKERLDKACDRWFTVKTMADKKQSPVTKLSTELEAARSRRAEIEQLLSAAQTALRQYEETLASLPELKRDAELTAKELERTEKECQAVRERKARFDLAAKGLEQCERLCEQANSKLREHDESVEQLRLATKSCEDLQLELRSVSEKRAQIEQEIAKARDVAEVARNNFKQHDQAREALNDRQRLIANHVQQLAIADKLSRAGALDAERQVIEQKLVGPAVLSESQINELRQKRDRAARLRAQLEAAEIRVTVKAKESLKVQVVRDKDAASATDLAANSEQSWNVRNHAAIQIGEHAVIQIDRGQDSRNVESMARECDELTSKLVADLTAAQVDPNDAGALDQLVARRLHHEENAKALKKLRQQMSEASPAGVPALQSAQERGLAERESILARRPEFRDWTPDQVELDRLRLEFDRQEAIHKKNVDDADVVVKRISQEVAAASERERTLQTRDTELNVQVTNLKERVTAVNRVTLESDVNQSAANLAESRRRLDESTLSDADRLLEMQFESTRVAHGSRAERLRQCEDRLLELRGQLNGTEGLHQKCIQAEQAVNDLCREFERESLYAGAHKHLKETFEQVRQQQVRRTVGPINDRVMQWANHLGLSDYAGLSFGDQLLPQGLVPTHATGDALDLERESYGTLEQLSLLIRLAVGGLLAHNEPSVAILDDPLAHADPSKHRKMLEILARAAQGEPHGPHPTGPLQLIVLTCHADRFDYLQDAQQIDLSRLIKRGG
jgi:DNA repair exonuclease SbcCD ATPase subunit